MTSFDRDVQIATLIAIVSFFGMLLLAASEKPTNCPTASPATLEDKNE